MCQTQFVSYSNMCSSGRIALCFRSLQSCTTTYCFLDACIVNPICGAICSCYRLCSELASWVTCSYLDYKSLPLFASSKSTALHSNLIILTNRSNFTGCHSTAPVSTCGGHGSVRNDRTPRRNITESPSPTPPTNVGTISSINASTYREVAANPANPTLLALGGTSTFIEHTGTWMTESWLASWWPIIVPCLLCIRCFLTLYAEVTKTRSIFIN